VLGKELGLLCETGGEQVADQPIALQLAAFLDDQVQLRQLRLLRALHIAPLDPSGDELEPYDVVDPELLSSRGQETVCSSGRQTNQSSLLRHI